MPDAITNLRRPARRFLRLSRFLVRGLFAPVFSTFELVLIISVLGWVHVGIVDQLSYVALVCAEQFTK